MTIRKFSPQSQNLEDLLESGTLDEDVISFLKQNIQEKKSLLISGGTSTGKTTLLNVLSEFIDPRERILVMEDSAELKLKQPHVLSLESRPPNSEGQGAVSLKDLVKNALRMRPDRLIIGECRGEEAFHLLQAFNTGHPGGFATLHANSPLGALRRLETLCLLAQNDLPLSIIRSQIQSALNLVVQLQRNLDGKRRLQSISEITSFQGEHWILKERVSWNQGRQIWQWVS